LLVPDLMGGFSTSGACAYAPVASKKPEIVRAHKSLFFVIGFAPDY